MSNKQHKTSIATFRQRQIFVQGASGIQPGIPVSEDLLRQKARERISKEAFDYIAGGAGKELTISNNRNGFNKWKIRPNMLNDVSSRDLSVKIFNRTLQSPFLLAPVGVLEMAHPEADLAVAKAAAATGIPMIFSNQASKSMEKVSAVMRESPRWFQLYWSKSDELVESLVKRAEKSGCEAIVITLDTTLLGWRERDLQLGFLPFLQGMGIAQYTSDPVFQSLLDQPEEEEESIKRKITPTTIRTLIRLVRRYPGSFWNNLRSGRPIKAVRKFINIYSRPSLSWEDIPRIRTYTSLPILLKGILTAEDAHKAVELGVDGIIVSNHGGRQVDGAISAIEALPEVAKAVDDRIPILMDSGIRTGADVFKALALGATAVCLGRPYVYALAIAGEAGVKEYLHNMMADFELTMGLAGCKNIAEVRNHQLATT